MALIPAPNSVTLPLIAEVNMTSVPDPSVTVRATVVQASTVFYDTPATLDKAERLVAEASSFGSQLVVFPEAFIGGYPRGTTFGVTIGRHSDKGKEDFQKYHATIVIPAFYVIAFLEIICCFMLQLDFTEFGEHSIACARFNI